MPSHPTRDRAWLLIPLAIYAVSRVIAGVLLHLSAVRQATVGPDATVPPGPHGLTTLVPDPPGYLGVISSWDGVWFRSIAQFGYPVPLPRVDGVVVPNEWAFSPGYPFVVRALMELAHIGFPLAATIVSTACGAAAVTLLYALVRGLIGDAAATRLVMAVCFFPSSPIFQVAYSESMALLLVVAALWALAGRRYGWLVVCAALLSVTRPIVLPLALLSGIVWIARWRARDREPFPRRERWIAAVATVVCAGLVGVWPAIAAVATGELGAFSDTMAVWPGNKVWGGAGVSWLTVAVDHPGSVGILVSVVLALALFTALRRGAQSLPVALRWWGPSYLAYMIVATKPSLGILRHLLLAIFPLAPLLEPVAPAESRGARAAQWALPVLLAVAGVVGQYFWITHAFRFYGTSSSFQAYP